MNPIKAVRDYIVGDHHLIPLEYESLNITSVELPKREDTGPTPAPTAEELANDPLYVGLGIVQAVVASGLALCAVLLAIDLIT